MIRFTINKVEKLYKDYIVKDIKVYKAIKLYKILGKCLPYTEFMLDISGHINMNKVPSRYL